MSIDVFIRVMSTSDELRKAMQYVSVVRWIMEGAQVWYLEDMGIREGRVYAEEHATSDPYVITDDDVLIMGKDWVNRAVDVMFRNPHFAIASTLSVIEGENLATGTGEIYEMHSIGAPMLIRKGTCKHLPELTLDNECGEIHRVVLDMGKKEGLISGLRHMHIGSGFSSNPILRWAY